MYLQSTDPEEYKKLRQEFQKDTMTKYWKYIEGIIQDNGGSLINGTSPTYADLIIAQSVPTIQSGSWDHIDTNFFDDYPGVLATMKAVLDNEKVKAYKDSKK
jgi:glutathione S-transferase